MPAEPSRPVVVSAVPTPFDGDGELDLASARRLFGFVGAGIDALFVAGTTGEFPALRKQERQQLFELALDAAGAERVIAHVGAASARQASVMTRTASASGVTRLAAITPYFLPADLDAVLGYYAAVVAAAGGAAVYAYLYPRVTNTVLTPAQTARVVRETGLSGVKLTGIDMGFVAELATLLPDLHILSGNDAMVADVARAGGHGVISAVSAVAPEPFARLAAAVGAGTDTSGPQGEVDALVAALGRIPVQKAVLRERGAIDSACCRMALDPATPAERDGALAAVAATR